MISRTQKSISCNRKTFSLWRKSQSKTRKVSIAQANSKVRARKAKQWEFEQWRFACHDTFIFDWSWVKRLFHERKTIEFRRSNIHSHWNRQRLILDEHECVRAKLREHKFCQATQVVHDQIKKINQIASCRWQARFQRHSHDSNQVSSQYSRERNLMFDHYSRQAYHYRWHALIETI